ncbi:S-adenosyl-L-methionine-dependent methyltransferase [Delitschia confertaspora ATCC 74209]|uniref:S-adenosyl-L-methionine-dependent methyltransferase n=1 Tax=Delitschia confertaspora ATCC 74209 TaxID=1513339 RepID=A0A9P4JB91_9PLEO|nr:S-adenosyl-L-methionine-dependent methyltransferase [Delitschia confertaspora ATCC 74209]
MASAQEINNERFNAEAASWDTNLTTVESSNKAFEAIKRLVPAFSNGTSKNLDVLELGCGTGLLSIQIAPLVRSLVGVDTSDGMVNAFNSKIANLPNPSSANLAAVNTLLENADDVHVQGAAAALASRRGESGHNQPYRFDLILSHLTLHHIPDMPGILRVLYQCLRPGGMIALTDFEDFGEGAVLFHPEDKRPGVERHGIKRSEMQEIIDGVGFNTVRVETAFVLKKKVEVEKGKPEEEREFPFLLCLGERD